MKTIRIATCAALLATAAPAFADQNGQTPPAGVPAKASEFETVSLAIYGPCQRATLTDVAAATAADATCSKLINDMDAVKQAAGANMSPHDTNIFHLVKSAAYLRVANALLVQDNNVRTARVCAKAEGAWSHGAKVDMAASPEAYVKLMQPMVTETAGLARLCRTAFAAPDGAAALPQ